MKTLLVSLVSDQPIPNVQLINELRSECHYFLFISTLEMEKKGVRRWIEEACKLQPDNLVGPLLVDPFSFNEIEREMGTFPFNDFDKVIVNLTGGTKVMTIAAFSFFEKRKAEIYYLTGSDDRLIRLTPDEKREPKNLRSSVDLDTYLASYGFASRRTVASSLSKDFTKNVFNHYIQGTWQKYQMTIHQLLTKRKNRAVDVSSITGLKEFLDEINFPSDSKDVLKGLEVKYLTGEWFEEYVTSAIKEDLQLENNQIETGLVIKKENREGKVVQNEMDVLLTWRNRIYAIECKTSVMAPAIQPNGNIKSHNILTDTLYKAFSLRQSMGLFANTSIFILDRIADNPEKYQDNLKRASLFNIRVIDRDDLTSGKRISELINIYP